MINSDLSSVALCKSCYTSVTDFATGLSKPDIAFNPWVLTDGKTCR